ncbi:MAG: hypothetical protein DCC71_09735 [Proteobacteria bacterium]|nr:MAG: hypothetical protein DCC71_09735 [Pseudomonadota bacterium]
MATAEGATAGPCTAAADETANIVIFAAELAFPTWSEEPAGLLEPFAALYAPTLGINGDGCGDACPFSNDGGDVTCGDLSQEPLGFSRVVALPEVGGSAYAFSEISGALAQNGKLAVGAGGFISTQAGAARDATRTYANFQAGWRDVLEIASSATEPQPLDFNLRIQRGDTNGFDGILCTGDFLRKNVVPALRFRVRDSVEPIGEPLLIDADSEDLAIGDNFFSVDVSPDAVLYVDVHLTAQVEATGDNADFTGATCDGGTATLDFRPTSGADPLDGLQLFLSGGPGVTVMSRSGFAYQPVPEPGARAAGWIAAAALARCATRRRRKQPQHPQRA